MVVGASEGWANNGLASIHGVGGSSRVRGFGERGGFCATGLTRLVRSLKDEFGVHAFKAEKNKFIYLCVSVK